MNSHRSMLGRAAIIAACHTSSQ